MRNLSFAIYYTDSDRLITSCLAPLAATLEDMGCPCFWERHHAGGRHLVLTVAVTPLRESPARTLIETEIGAFLARHPAMDDREYDVAKTRELLVMEGADPDAHDLDYRNNHLAERVYVAERAGFASREAVLLLEDFLRDAKPLVLALIEDPATKEHKMLEIFFLNTWLDNGGYEAGAISFCSHWEGFRMQLADAGCPELGDLVVGKQAELSPSLQALMQDVVARGRFETPHLKDYEALTRVYRQRARSLIREGCRLFPDHLKLGQTGHPPPQREDSAFVKTLHEEGFLDLARKDLGFNTIRSATNLLYVLVHAVGLSAFHKFKLGYLVFKTIEDHYGIDSHQKLREGLEQLRKRHLPPTIVEGAA